MVRLLLSALVFFAGSGAHTALAQPDSSAVEAEAHYVASRAAMADGRYDLAIQELSVAYQLLREQQSGDPVFVFVSGGDTDSLLAMRRYVEHMLAGRAAVVPPSASAARSETAAPAHPTTPETVVAPTDAPPGAQAVTSVPDSQPMPATSGVETEATAASEPPRRSSRRGQPNPRGQPQPQGEAAPELTSAFEGGTGPSALWYVLTGIGVAGLATGSVLAVLTAGDETDLEARCPANLCPADAAQELADARDQATLTDIVLISSGALIAVGVIGLLAGSGSSDSAPPPVTAGCGPRGCMASLQGQF